MHSIISIPNLDESVKKCVEIYPKRTQLFKTEKMNQFIEDGKLLADPVELLPNVLVENETTILFGDTGIGKSTYAIQCAIDIAEQGKRTLVVNFELSQKQLSKRFTNKTIPETLHISCPNYPELDDVYNQRMILDEIEQTALEYKSEVIIIDNLTNLCLNAKEGEEAGRVMQQFIKLRMKYKWSMLILAHVPKRKPTDPLTINDLAGSKIISNSVDNVIGLNRSKKGKDIRYLIQLKYRSFPVTLDSKHVQELKLVDTDGYLHFEYGGFDNEYTHLPRSRDEKAELEQEIVKELKAKNGLSYRGIAEKLETSLATVQRVAEKHNLGRKQQSK